MSKPSQGELQARLVELKLGGCPYCGSAVNVRNGHVICASHGTRCPHRAYCVLHIEAALAGEHVCEYAQPDCNRLAEWECVLDYNLTLAYLCHSHALQGVKWMRSVKSVKSANGCHFSAVMAGLSHDEARRLLWRARHSLRQAIKHSR